MIRNLTRAFTATLLLAQSALAAPIAGIAVSHTPPKDQGGVGFCWSYSVNGLMEGEFLKRTGKPVNLSEEYLGFYGMYQRLLENLPILYSLGRNDAPVTGLDRKMMIPIRKYIIKLLLAPSEGAPNLTEPLKLLNQYGAVPESVFFEKFPKSKGSLEERLGNFVAEKLLLKSQVETYQNNTEMLFNDFAAVFGAKPPKVTDTFVFLRKIYTPLTFVSNYLKFRASDYVEIEVKRDTQAHALAIIKRSLEDRSAVELAFRIFEENYDTAKSTGRFEDDSCPNGLCTSLAGGHAVLIVNSEYDPVSEFPLSALIVKNSWAKTGVDENGEATSKISDRGFYVISAGYLNMGWIQPNSQTPAYAAPTRTMWSILVNKRYID
ncbi:hypothetical protein WDW86_19785 [Bdellovibrionota bacterium FG-2]